MISLFHDTSALGIKPDDIGGCPVGCLGIPEFGTDFVIQMVVDTKPNTISDLIRISGLSHGTDVWLNNAQELIRSGKATISTAICTRDDIMTYLINKGMDSEESFTIMERVRKGTVAKGKCKEWPEFKKDMAEHNVPDWYVWSCEQIKYMFPKAHAAAYVMMAYRIAYCKINYPLAYYGAYFGIRADAFSYEIMCQGKEKLQYYIDDYNRRSATLSKKEQDTMKDMKIVQEMYARGFEFEPLDIYKAQATKFLIVNGKLMPPLSSIDGMGEKAAEAVAEASKDGTYLSLDDFRQRTKASKTVIDTMVDLGILADLPASNQLSLFDFRREITDGRIKQSQITYWCHEIIRSQAEAGGCYIDATMGKGNDTLFLCELAGENGKVLAFDIQQEALDATRRITKGHTEKSNRRN